MRTKKILRHYCEFCSKGSFKRPSMIEHEALCTLNPNRVCLLCETERDLAPSIKAIKDAGSQDSDGSIHLQDKEVFMNVFHTVESCPACMLAVLRQSKTAAFDLFDYKKEKQEYMREKFQEIGMACR